MDSINGQDSHKKKKNTKIKNNSTVKSVLETNSFSKTSKKNTKVNAKRHSIILVDTTGTIKENQRKLVRNDAGYLYTPKNKTAALKQEAKKLPSKSIKQSEGSSISAPLFSGLIEEIKDIEPGEEAVVYFDLPESEHRPIFEVEKTTTPTEEEKGGFGFKKFFNKLKSLTSGNKNKKKETLPVKSALKDQDQVKKENNVETPTPALESDKKVVRLKLRNKPEHMEFYTAPLDKTLTESINKQEKPEEIKKEASTEEKVPKKVPLFSFKSVPSETINVTVVSDENIPLKEVNIGAQAESGELSFDDLVSTIPVTEEINNQPTSKVSLLEELESGRYQPEYRSSTSPFPEMVNTRVDLEEDIEPTKVIGEDVKAVLNQDQLNFKDLVMEDIGLQAETKPNPNIYIEPNNLEKRRKDTRRHLRRQEQAETIKTEIQEQKTGNGKEVVTNEKWIFANVPKEILLGGITLFNNLTKQLRANGKLKVETLMSILGALAGYSVQEAIREKMVRNMGLNEETVFSVVETKNGEKYFFAEAIDQGLQKDHDSVWNMAASATARLTGRVDVDIDEIIRYNTRTLGSTAFGVPRLPQQLKPSHIPSYYVEHMWAALRPGLDRFTDDPLQWPLIFSVAIQRALILTASTLNPSISLKIIMESAVPMAMAETRPLNYHSKLSELETLDYEIFRLKREIETLREQLTKAELTDDRRRALTKEYSKRTERYFEISARRDTLLINEGRRSIE